MTIFVQILEESNQFLHDIVHIVTALIVHIWISVCVLYIFLLVIEFTVSIPNQNSTCRHKVSIF